jgi:indolepyruvate ferredoxin oxidoreductase
VSVTPVETEFGRKRAIDQSACNKDYSCVEGFCPSFVTVEGGRLRKPKKADAADFPSLPEPARVASDKPYGILVTGIGGTGVVTIGALLGMAAHLEGKGVSVLDMTGLAQKNGAVVSHVRIADDPAQLYATRIAAGEAKLVLACDILTGIGDEALAKMQKGVTKALVNSARVMPAQFTREPDLAFPIGSMEQEIKDGVGPGDAEFLDATRLATGLMGDSIATNLFMVGYAWQRGLLPLSEASILRAIELNGAAVDANVQSFRWGRLAAVDPQRVAAAAIPAAVPDSQRLSGSLDEAIERRRKFLTEYQDAKYAARYTDFVARVRAAENAKEPGATDLTEAVARNHFKLLAVKDEYEVARLYAETDFLDRIAAQFEGDYRLRFHLAPPALNHPDAATGEAKKSEYGPWMMPAFRVLAKMRRLRGGPLDVFGRTAERRQERALAADYERQIDALLAGLSPHNYAIAVEIASIPEHIRGYGHVRARHLAEAKKREAELLEHFASATTAAAARVAEAQAAD